MRGHFVLTVILGLLMCMVSAVAWAYPSHLNGDSNYVLVDGHQGIGWYIDRSSLVVQQYEPPCYTIAVNVVTAVSATGNERDFFAGNGAGQITDVKTCRFFYNYDDTAMYYDTTGNNGWQKLHPLGTWADSGYRMSAGEMAFYLAYNMKFYGAYTWNGNGMKHVTVFDDSFYTPAR